MPETDTVQWDVAFRIDRYDADQVAETGLSAPTVEDFERLGIAPAGSSEVLHNLLTTAGLSRLTNLLTGGGGQALTNTSARLGVGNGAGSAAVGDTDLSASAGGSNRQFKVMDATYPQVSGGVVTLRSTFASGEANFAWNEWGIDIGAPTVADGTTVAALLLNHKTGIAQGTKASGQVWTATATVTFS